jgi:hypothetical protein
MPAPLAKLAFRPLSSQKSRDPVGFMHIDSVGALPSSSHGLADEMSAGALAIARPIVRRLRRCRWIADHGAGFIVLAVVAAGLAAGCSSSGKLAGKPAPANPPESGVTISARTTVETPLRGSACKREIDHADPNETPFEVCPGPSGYALVVRRVEAGRASVDVLDPDRRRFPLELEATVTRHMLSLDGPAHWRVLSFDGRSRPIALILRVNVHEDPDPARFTRALLALAKISDGAACVVKVSPEDDPRSADEDAWLDASAKLACAAMLPPLDLDTPRSR